MTPLTSVDPTDTGDRIERPTPSRPGGVGWLARALMLSLSCLVVHCGDDSNTSTSSGGTGGATTTTGGATSSGGSASGGANASGGAQTSGSGGASAGTGGSGGTSGSTSGGGTAPTGGTGGSKTGGSGGTATGGASGAGGAAGSGGKNPSGGTSTGGTGDGGATTGGSSDGGATTGGTGDGGASTGGSSDGGAGGTTGGPFTVTSPGWENAEGCSTDAKMSCAPVPTAMTRQSGGQGTSPELTWTGAPEGTQSFAILFQDLSGNSIHWVLWNIAPTATTLPANIDQTTATPDVPAGSQQCGKGTDAATDNGYYGPGAPCNVYELTAYALSIETFSPTAPTDPAQVATQLQALGSSILGTASIRGRTDTGC